MPAPACDGPVSIRDLSSPEDYEACAALQTSTWGAGFTERVPPSILRVAQKIGGVAAGAFGPDGRLVGFVFGLAGVRDGRIVHWSDMLAVERAWRGRRVGEALKRHQAERARAAGAQTMLWTYDPLVAGNAHLNLSRLGARPVEYLVDAYGSRTGSPLHGALPTDRFLVEWDLRAPAVVARSGTAAPGDADGPLLDPLEDDASGADGPSVRVRVPADFADLQLRDAASALRWRMGFRGCARSLIERGFRVERFVREASGATPFYVFVRPAP